MQRYNILWADDEIDLLKPHILFLEQKGYNVTAVNSGSEALDLCAEEYFDVVFLDENMPGMSGLEVLAEIKKQYPSIPVVMVTKSEEEQIMEEAIGSKIADYLIKPLNPNQLLLSVKRILENKRIVSEKTNMGYQREFQEISMAVGDDLDHQEWIEIYRKLVFWELEMDSAQSEGMMEILESQKLEANAGFFKFISENYQEWLTSSGRDKPLLSHNVLQEKVIPQLGEKPVFWIIIDNLRFDQWKTIEPLVRDLFEVQAEEFYYSILPTTTAYSRNALFSGMLPLEMERNYPDLWVGEDQEGGKNLNEESFLGQALDRLNQNIKYSYHKILNQKQGRQLVESASNLLGNDLNAIVFNFVDMLSHARTEMEMIRELAPDESAYRSITRSWFLHSPMYDLLKKLAEQPVRLVVSTDHGTIRVKKPFKIIGDRQTNTNLRYKLGRNLSYDEGTVLEVKNPEKFHLPKPNVSTSYVFAQQNDFFAYPNNYNYYVNYFKDTFQHGGISLEEMIIPLISLTSKNTG